MCIKSLHYIYHTTMSAFKELAKIICDGYMLSEAEAYELLDMPSEDLRQAALLVSKQMVPRKFDSCSIINARSGHCSELQLVCTVGTLFHRMSELRCGRP